MIDILKLEAYSQDLQDNIANIGANFLFADDSEYAGVTKDIVTEDTNVTLMTLIPSVAGKAPDEDSLEYINKMMFLCVKKTDSKAGHDNYLQIFADCQTALNDLIEKLILDQTTGAGRCDIGEFLFNTIRIDPIRGLSGTNGYELSIDLLTY